MLYHRDVFMPRKIKAAVPQKTIRPTYSGHAMAAAKTDRYGKLTLPTEIDLSKATLIEAEIYKSGLAKIVVRVTMNETLDLCLAIIPDCWVVKTVWANEVNDVHYTLDPTPYVRQ